MAFLLVFQCLHYCHPSFCVITLGNVEVTSVDEGLAQLLAGSDTSLAVLCAKVEPSPVDAHVVAFLAEDVLRNAAGLHPDAAVLLEGFRM